MDKFEFPYNGKKCTKKFAIKKKGIYIIQDLLGTIMYIGMSKSCLYKAMYRHFQKWNSYQYRVTYPDRNNYKVRIIIINDINRIDYIERRLINYFNPIDNNKYHPVPEFEEVTDLPF